MLGAASIQIAFNLGNALGAWCGGIPIARGLAPRYTALPGALLAFGGFLLFAIYCRRFGRSEKTYDESFERQ